MYLPSVAWRGWARLSDGRQMVWHRRAVMVEWHCRGESCGFGCRASGMLVISGDCMKMQASCERLRVVLWALSDRFFVAY